MLNLSAISRFLGILLIFFACTFSVPLFIEFVYQDAAYLPYIITMLVSLSIGCVCYYLGEASSIIRLDGFFLVLVAWVAMILIAAIPFVFFINDFSYLDSVFEAASGLTTCGAEMIVNLKDLGHSLLFYHQYLQFLGGMGIIVLAVGVLPMLNNGQKSITFDAPNEVAKDKIVPKIADIAKILWGIYCALTILCVMGYLAVGLSFFDAVCAAFATISTGGFAIYNDNLGFYHNTYLPWVSMFFMFVSAIGFN